MTEKSLKFYTGLNMAMFLALATAFASRVSSFGKSYMDAGDQLLLILSRLRLNLLMKDIAIRFDISSCICSKIFGDGIIQLAQILSDALLWLPRERIQSTMPQQFKELFPFTTCIIDCSEVFCQRPEGLMARAKLYSNYKAHNTYKYLVAVAPSGFIMFLSKAYGGRASDKFICSDSGFYQYLDSEDQVMGDRGFDIETELGVRGITLNIPAFTRGKKLTNFDCTMTRRIASVRIHVERVIGRMKNYRILKSVMPIQTSKYIDSILIVCAGLTNLQKPIVNSKKMFN